jgi:hypothetical protein
VRGSATATYVRDHVRCGAAVALAIIRGLRANFELKYDDAQREAIERAYVDEQLRPSLIIQLAAMGELKHQGQPVAPFEIPYNSARYIGDRAKKRREDGISSRGSAKGG